MTEVSDDGRSPEQDALMARRTAAWTLDRHIRHTVDLAYLRVACGSTPEDAIAQCSILGQAAPPYGALLHPEELGPLSVSQAVALALSRYRSWVATLGIGELPSDPLDMEND